MNYLRNTADLSWSGADSRFCYKRLEMDKILSFGGGLQTTALAIMVAEGKLDIDMAVFADTGGEKPETYWYIDTYIKPLFQDLKIPLHIIRREKTAYYEPTLYDFLWKIKDVPSVYQRRCTDHYKLRVIRKFTGRDVVMIVGFSLDEAYRARRRRPVWAINEFPLIEREITANDCRQIIQQYGWTLPLKSSCYFCPFQHPTEWNWLKNNHPELFEKALALERNYHERKPEMRDYYGLLRGTPLRKLKDGLQPEMFADVGDSCWSGHCGH